jgi:chemotaxis protein MotB
MPRRWRGSGSRLISRFYFRVFVFIMDKVHPIIIVKKKGGHGGHHGGAWKVAYADFVTAMMALFMVMWLMSSSKPMKEAISGYFRDPNGTSAKAGSTLAGTGESFQVNKDNMPELKDQLQKKMHEMNHLDKLKDHVEMTVTSEGLRIELMESASGTFFDSGSPKLNGDGQDLLITLAHELGKLPNRLSIEGHTDSKPYSSSGGYSNWELSTDRANAARRLMQANGVGADQITQVRGYADQSLRKPDNPLDAANRRISLIVQYLPKTEEDAPAAEGEAKGEGKEGKGEAKGEEKKSGEEAKPSPAKDDKKPAGKKE